MFVAVFPAGVLRDVANESEQQLYCLQVTLVCAVQPDYVFERCSGFANR
jgi:hypothetical protein